MMVFLRRLLLPGALIVAGLIIWRNQELRQRLLGLVGVGGSEADELVHAGVAEAEAAGGRAAPSNFTSSNTGDSSLAADPSPAANPPAPPRPAQLASRADPDAGQLDAYGDDETTNDRVLSRLGRLMQSEGLGRLNINTQAGGVVFLRGAVRTQEQVDQILAIVGETEGVGDIVNELQVMPEE